MLGIIEAAGGAAHAARGWQRQVLAALEAQMPRADALAALLERYREHSASGRPCTSGPPGDLRLEGRVPAEGQTHHVGHAAVGAGEERGGALVSDSSTSWYARSRGSHPGAVAGAEGRA